MRKTITVALYRRPEYSHQVLTSLTQALRNCPEFQPDRILIGVDKLAPEHASADTEAAVAQVVKDFKRNNINRFHLEVIPWYEHLGVNEHPRRLLQMAFSEVHSDFNLHVEDDTVLSLDAIRLVEWYARTRHTIDGMKCDVRYDRALTLCLYNPSRDFEHSARLYLANGFAPWGWACHADAWRNYLMPLWNHKRELPIGWDWSIRATIEKFGLKSITPSLSRVTNIGRENGQYQTPAGYDSDFEGVVAAGPQHMTEIADFRLA